MEIWVLKKDPDSWETTELDYNESLGFIPTILKLLEEQPGKFYIVPGAEISGTARAIFGPSDTNMSVNHFLMLIVGSLRLMGTRRGIQAREIPDDPSKGFDEWDTPALEIEARN